MLTNKKRYLHYLIPLSIVLIVSIFCYFISALIGYKVVAFILLVTVSLIAMTFDIMPVLIASILSALIWNFFFIPPTFTFHIGSTEDVLLFFMYFIIASVSTVLTYKIRKIEKGINKKIEEENTLKLYNTVLNSLSHELKTPIATILVATDNLQNQQDKLSEHNKKELVAEISKASIRLNTQVVNLLNMSRLDSGYIKPKLDWCDIHELVHGTINNLKDYYKNKIVQIDIEENIPFCKIDVGLLEQVLYNIIYNACIYNADGIVIKISAKVKNDNLFFTIEDTGKGFKPEDIEKVFNKFYRADINIAGGTGLGLSIAKGFVEAHNGTISLQNNMPNGAIFIIQIPVQTSYINNLRNE